MLGLLVAPVYQFGNTVHPPSPSKTSAFLQREYWWEEIYYSNYNLASWCPSLEIKVLIIHCRSERSVYPKNGAVSVSKM